MRSAPAPDLLPIPGMNQGVAVAAGSGGSADFYRRLFQVNRDLATAGLDLGQSPQEIGVRMATAARALYHSVIARPTYCEPVDALEGFCGLGVACDASATRTFASLYAATAEGSSGGDPKKTRVPMYWGLANVLVAHATGAPSLTAAAAWLQKLRLPKDEAPKVTAIREAFRALAVHCATAKALVDGAGRRVRVRAAVCPGDSVLSPGEASGRLRARPDLDGSASSNRRRASRSRGGRVFDIESH